MRAQHQLYRAGYLQISSCTLDSFENLKDLFIVGDTYLPALNVHIIWRLAFYSCTLWKKRYTLYLWEKYQNNALSFFLIYMEKKISFFWGYGGIIPVLVRCNFSLQTLKKQRYRFSLIVNELRMAELVPYKTTLMAFVNCIIVANEELEDRSRVRNEFIGRYNV